MYYGTSWGKKSSFSSPGPDDPVYRVTRYLYRHYPNTPVAVREEFFTNSHGTSIEESNPVEYLVYLLQDAEAYIKALGYTEISLELRGCGDGPKDESSVEAFFLGERDATEDEIAKGEPA